MKKIAFLLVFLMLGFILIGCKSNDKSYHLPDEIEPGDHDTGDVADPSDKTEGEMPDAGYSDDDGSDISPVEIPGDGTIDPVGDGDVQAGQLTASEWSDIQNYSYYLNLFQSSQDSPVGLFTEYFNQGYFDTLNMVEVTVKAGETNLSGARVKLLNASQEPVFEAMTNANGKAYLFPQTGQLDSITNIDVGYLDHMVSQPYHFSAETNSVTINIDAENTHQDAIEIMFVVDTTGSMGDEITYLKAEIDYVVTQVQENVPNASIRLALMFYRDFGDEFVTRYFDFTTDILTQKNNLSKQFAAGGGDFEEAVDVALTEAVSKTWSAENTTKLIFHVLDARPHYTQDIMTRYFNAISAAAQKGIRIIPVASSGIDKYTEYLLRNEAMMTGGTYVFITDDSGIGGEHLEATVGETVVEYLNRLLIRLISEYHTGIAQEKVPYADAGQ